jgi:hypothetical protein
MTPVSEMPMTDARNNGRLEVAIMVSFPALTYSSLSWERSEYASTQQRGI